MKSKSYKKIIIGVIIVAIIAIIGVVIKIAGDYLQLLEIGEKYTSIFWVDLEVKASTFFTCGILSFLCFFVNFKMLTKNLKAISSHFSYLKSFFPFTICAIVTGIICGVIGMNTISDTVLPFVTAESFNLKDPIFNNDIGYYVFQRPFFMAVINAVTSYLGFIIIAVSLCYAVMYARFDVSGFKNILKQKRITLHGIVLLIIYFGVHIFSYKMSAQSLLFKTNKSFVGAGYVDITVWKNFYTYCPYLIIAVIIASIFFIKKHKKIATFITIGIYPLSIVIVYLISIFVQAVIVAPNELTIESKYIDNNIKYTRSAYKIDNISSMDFMTTNDLDSNKITENMDTINNIRLTDFSQTLNALNQVQTIKNYYTFTDSDMAIYKINGKDTVVSIGAREIDESLIPDAGKNYINTKMKYTHGMGVVMNPVNVITDEGQPYFTIRDVPPKSVNGAPNITQPRIYYGEKTNDYVIVNTKDKELDDIQPSGYSYQGNSGLRLNFLTRLLYSIRYADFNLLVSGQIDSESKLLVNRNILERVNKVAPFLEYDQDPVILIDDNGRLKWVIDGYTKSSNFPYSEYCTDNCNYIRNSVKVVVDAYDGDVKFYIIDKEDPIIRSYARIYPSIFESGDLPVELASHIRYPEKLFKIQASMLKKYHITDASQFYQKRGMWAITKEKSNADKAYETAPYYTMMKVDGNKPEFVLMIPYTLSGRDNMIAWLCVKCSNESYGQMVLYNFDQNKNVYGPYQIENKIDTDAEISKDLSLWGQGGSTVVRGNMMVVPIGGNILYIEPIFISSGVENQTLPEIKKVVVAYNDKISSGPNLETALSKMFGVSMPKVELNEDTESLNDMIYDIITKYDNVKKAKEKGSWEGYGTSMSELEKSINEMRDYMKENDKEFKETEDKEEGKEDE